MPQKHRIEWLKRVAVLLGIGAECRGNEKKNDESTIFYQVDLVHFGIFAYDVWLCGCLHAIRNSFPNHRALYYVGQRCDRCASICFCVDIYKLARVCCWLEFSVTLKLPFCHMHTFVKGSTHYICIYDTTRRLISTQRYLHFFRFLCMCVCLVFSCDFLWTIHYSVHIWLNTHTCFLVFFPLHNWKVW